MDLNIVVVAGRLAAEPEIRVFDGGATLVRYLVTTRLETPRRRIDVVPVVLWDGDENATDFERGDRIWVAGSIQRRFWSDDHNRRSRIEVVAHHVQKHAADDVLLSRPGTPPMVDETMRV
ncbi:MAG: single-stranded DNA-binding protein [Acidimicrobiia bacterium]